MPLSLKAELAKDVKAGLGEMQHRHFATIATILREIPDDMFSRAIANHFADRLAETNPRFNRQRFLSACMKSD